MKLDNQQTELLVKEYQATQEMIRHYDDLTMRFGSTTQAGVLIFIGLSFGLLTKDKSVFLYVFPVVILFVAMSNLLIHMWFKRHRSITQIKIRRILQIEKELGLRQFTMVDEAFKSGKVESRPIRKMLKIYYCVLPVVLAIVYLIVLCSC